MKRILAGLLLSALLTGCGGKPSLAGVWEQELSLSILGQAQQQQVQSIARFTFREDGTGTREQIIPDGSHPDAAEDFLWRMEADMLVLDFGQGRQQSFTAAPEEDRLVLENPRGSFDLKKVE